MLFFPSNGCPPTVVLVNLTEFQSVDLSESNFYRKLELAGALKIRRNGCHHFRRSVKLVRGALTDVVALEDRNLWSASRKQMVR